jgi:hypothetical protein
MKRFRFLLVLTILLCAGAAVYASSTITVKPSEMKSGETKTVIDDGKTIRITRDGDSLKVTVEGAGKTKQITIQNGADGEVKIEGDDGHRTRRIIVNGTALGDLLDHRIFRPHHDQTWFVCPKDHAMLRVPEVKDGDTFKCPVDGTAMEKRKGRGFSFFFDDDFDSEDL